MKKMLDQIKQRLACRCEVNDEVNDNVIIAIPYDVRYDIKFEIRKYHGWYALSEHDGCWYLLGESKSTAAIVDKILKEHGGLALYEKNL